MVSSEGNLGSQEKGRQLFHAHHALLSEIQDPVRLRILASEIQDPVLPCTVLYWIVSDSGAAMQSL